MARKEIVVYRSDLKQIQSKEEALAIAPVRDPKPLTIIPLKQLGIVPPRHHYEQDYFAQACWPTLPSPPTKLLLKGPKVAIPQGTKLLPTVDNEKLIKVTTNRFRDVTCAKYASSRISLDGIHAPPGQVKYVAPRETSKRFAAPQIEREAKHPRMTMAMMEEKFNDLNQTIEVMKISSKVQAGSITNLQNQRSDDLKEIHRLTRIIAALSEKNKNKEYMS
jgi:hypothetical protein